MVEPISLFLAIKGIVSYYGHAATAGAAKGALTGAGMFFTFSHFQVSVMLTQTAYKEKLLLQKALLPTPLLLLQAKVPPSVGEKPPVRRGLQRTQQPRP